MPWDCKQCNTHVESDSQVTCPQCGTRKGLWTLAGGRTRTFRVRGKKFELLFGTGRDPRPAAQGWPNDEKQLHAERVVAVEKGVARGWAEQRMLPPTEQVLVVRCWPSASDSKVVKLTVEYTDGIEKVCSFAVESAPRQLGDKTYYDERFLFVYGPGDAGDLGFDGVKVVDVSDSKSSPGHAPRVGVAALGTPRRTILFVDRLQKGWAQRLQCRQLDFNHDSHLLLPDGLSVLALVLQHAKDNPDQRLVIAGHTDASGENKRNDALSRDRCLNILHMLEGDRDAWAESALASYLHLQKTDAAKAKRDASFIEDWVGRPPNPPDPSEWEGFKGFVKRHQAVYGSSGPTLDPAKGWTDLASWKAVFDFYDDALLDEVASPLLPPEVRVEASKKPTEAERQLYLAQERKKHDAKRRETLKRLRAGLRWVDPARKTVGCGERYLKVKTPSKAMTNRRDEFLFFAQDRLPWDPASPPADEAAAREALYGTGGPTWNYNNNDGPWIFDALDCPKPPAIEVPPGNVLFVIDVSDSMDTIDPVEKNKPQPRPRVEVCKDRLLETLRAVPEGRCFGLVAFATDVTPWASGQLLPASRRSKELAYRWVEDLRAITEHGGGSTNTYRALMDALKVENVDVDSIVFLSDGLPTWGLTNEHKILEQVARRNGRLPKRRQIHTYGFLEGQGLVTPATRTEVGNTYHAVLKDTPDVGFDRDALIIKVAANLKAQGVKSTSNKFLTAADVKKVVLGWFLEELAKQNGGTFTDLNAIED